MSLHFLHCTPFHPISFPFTSIPFNCVFLSPSIALYRFKKNTHRSLSWTATGSHHHFLPEKQIPHQDFGGTNPTAAYSWEPAWNCSVQWNHQIIDWLIDSVMIKSYIIYEKHIELTFFTTLRGQRDFLSAGDGDSFSHQNQFGLHSENRVKRWRLLSNWSNNVL